jgi:hypothetical protein
MTASYTTDANATPPADDCFCPGRATELATATARRRASNRALGLIR